MCQDLINLTVILTRSRFQSARNINFVAQTLIGLSRDGDRYHPGGDPTRGGLVSSKNHHMYLLLR
eukprot:COSAG05_NODE_2265_length_3314_cov_55.001758_4_plen_65_part_00